MTHKLPLDTLIELAQTRADEATRRLGELQTAHHSAEQKLKLLNDYRQEYLTQFETHLHDGVSAAHLHNFRQFIATLDQAIEQQRALTTQADSRLASGRNDWQRSRCRLNSFDTLATRLQRQELAALARREQRDNDERVARQFYLRSSAQND